MGSYFKDLHLCTLLLLTRTGSRLLLQVEKNEMLRLYSLIQKYAHIDEQLSGPEDIEEWRT